MEYSQPEVFVSYSAPDLYETATGFVSANFCDPINRNGDLGNTCPGS